jgi:hypothetical protein
LQAAAPSGTRALRLVTGPVAQHAFPDKAEMPLSLRQCLHMRNTAAHGYLGFALARRPIGPGHRPHLKANFMTLTKNYVSKAGSTH